LLYYFCWWRNNLIIVLIKSNFNDMKKFLLFVFAVTFVFTGFFNTNVAEAQNTDNRDCGLITRQWEMGSVSGEITNLQTFLKDRGFLPGNFVVNEKAIFDVSTLQGVVNFQIANNLISNNGFLDQNTRDVINAQICAIDVMAPAFGDRFVSGQSVYIGWSTEYSDPNSFRAYLQKKTPNGYEDLGEALPSQKGSIIWGGDVDTYGNRPDLDGQFRFKVIHTGLGIEGFSEEFTMLPRNYVGNITGVVHTDDVGWVFSNIGSAFAVPHANKTNRFVYIIGQNLSDCSLIVQGSNGNRNIFSGFSRFGATDVSLNHSRSLNPFIDPNDGTGFYQIELSCNIENITDQSSYSSGLRFNQQRSAYFRMQAERGGDVVIDRILGIQTGEENKVTPGGTARIYGSYGPGGHIDYYVVFSGGNINTRYKADLSFSGVLSIVVPRLPSGRYNVHVEYNDPSGSIIKSNTLRDVQVGLHPVPIELLLPSLNPPTTQLPGYVPGKDAGSVNGTNLTGATVYFNGTAISPRLYTFVSDYRISFMMPTFESGSYPVYVESPDGVKSNTIYITIPSGDFTPQISNVRIQGLSQGQAWTHDLYRTVTWNSSNLGDMDRVQLFLCNSDRCWPDSVRIDGRVVTGLTENRGQAEFRVWALDKPDRDDYFIRVRNERTNIYSDSPRFSLGYPEISNVRIQGLSEGQNWNHNERKIITWNSQHLGDRSGIRAHLCNPESCWPLDSIVDGQSVSGYIPDSGRMEVSMWARNKPARNDYYIRIRNERITIFDRSPNFSLNMSAEASLGSQGQLATVLWELEDVIDRLSRLFAR